jgi:hypothetical protein
MKKKPYFWKVVILLGLILFLLNSAVFVFLGQVNVDEGWYLYAGRLVYAGQRPYQDFAFTQTPLLPYIYGIPQSLIFPSIYLGRITSVVLSSAAFALAVFIARRHGGDMAGGITALLGGTFTFGIYFQSITKTYSLTTLFFMLTFLALSLNARKELRLSLATLFTLLAILTRLSAIFFAIPLLVYILVVSNWKNRLLNIGLCLAAFSWVLILALPNADAAVWGLVTHHTAQWGNKTTAERAAQIFGSRIPNLLRIFFPYVLLWITVLALGFKQIKENIGRYFEIFLLVTGLSLFAIPNLTSGGFYSDYFVPLIFTMLPITGIVYTKIIPKQGKYSRPVMVAALLSTMIVGSAYGGYESIDVVSGLPPVEEIRSISSVIAEKTTRQDKVLALEAFWAVVDADRSAAPNMTMAQFSFYDVDAKTVERLRLVNGQTIAGYVENGIPKVVVLTDLDWDILKRTSQYAEIATSLKKNYRLILSRDSFGQRNNHVDVYIKNEEP